MGVTVDSNFIIHILRSDPAALAKAKEIEDRGEAKFLSTPVLYEISAGLLFTRSRTEAAAFRALSSRFGSLPFDEPAALKAAEIRAELLRMGRAKSHVDTMIAGIALEGSHVLITRDRDFKDIGETVGLNVEAY